MPFQKSQISSLVHCSVFYWLIMTAVVVGLYASGCSKTEEVKEPVTLTGDAMGTGYVVKIIAGPDFTDSQREELATEITNLLAGIYGLISAEDENSEIASFNRSSDTGWVAVSTSTARVVAQALNISALTDGAFDITVGPIEELWRPGPGYTTGEVPTDQQIEMAKERSGYQYLFAQLSPTSLRKRKPNIQCDPGVLAGGFGVDRVLGLLKSKGYSDYLVQIGGEAGASGVNERGTPWPVPMLQPQAAARTTATVYLGNACLAGSATDLNTFEMDGRNYSALIDPRSARPVGHNLASVVVVDEACLRAKALAAAIHVLGPDEGYDLAVRLGLAAMLITKDGDAFVEHPTPRMERYLGESKK